MMLYKNPRRIGQRNSEQLRIRIPMEFKYKDMMIAPDGSMFFNVIFCPWRNVNTTTDLLATPMQLGQNRLYSADISHMKALYQKFRLGWVNIELDRPKIYCGNAQGSSIGGPQLFQPTGHFGSAVIHSELVVKPDSVTDTVESNVDVGLKTVDTTPNSWREGVDNQSSRFNLHYDHKKIRLNWKPTTEFERKWIDKDFSDQELMTGGVHLRFKTKEPIPEIANFSYHNEQVILQGYVTYAMMFKDRT